MDRGLIIIHNSCLVYYYYYYYYYYCHRRRLILHEEEAGLSLFPGPSAELAVPAGPVPEIEFVMESVFMKCSYLAPQ